MLSMAFLVALTFNPAAAQSPASDARQIALGPLQMIGQVDTGNVKGNPWRLAWSPDGTELYLQVADRDSRGAVKSSRGYLVSLAGKTLKSTDQEPAWASKYWTWKSAQTSPAAPAFKIDVDQRQQTVRATAAPAGGDIAKGGVPDPLSGTSVSDAAGAAYQSQTQTIFRLRLKGTTIGEWVNEPVTPGVNFGWAPAPHRLLAFASRTGGPIVLLDDQGRTQELADTKAAVLPAWSDDGSKIAWLERRDKKRYELMIATVSSK